MMFAQNPKNKNEIAPEVGMGCTINLYSDRHAATIIYVSPTKTVIRVQQDKAIRIDTNGMSESQQYRYERDEDGQIDRFNWAPSKNIYRAKYNAQLTPERNEYYDYSF